MLLWLWSGPAVVALVRPLAWESPYAAGAALKTRKKKKRIKDLNVNDVSGTFVSALCVLTHLI